MAKEPQKAPNERKVRSLVEQKLNISQKIQELRTERARLNTQLLEAGASAAEIAAW